MNMFMKFWVFYSSVCLLIVVIGCELGFVFDDSVYENQSSALFMGVDVGFVDVDIMILIFIIIMFSAKKVGKC